MSRNFSLTHTQGLFANCRSIQHKKA